MPPGDVYYTTCRLNRDVEAALRAYAKRNERSINDSINRVLRTALITPVNPQPSKVSATVPGEGQSRTG